MEITEFNEMVQNVDGEKSKFEIDCLFRHCDQRGLGYITKEDLKQALVTPLQLQNKI